MGAEAHEIGETEPAQPAASVAGVTPVRVSLCLQGLSYIGLEGLERVSGRLVGGTAGLATGTTRRAGRQQDDQADGSDRGQGDDADLLDGLGVTAGGVLQGQRRGSAAPNVFRRP